MSELLVRDLMTEDPITVGPEDTLARALDIMETRHIRHLPVVDAQGELVGLLSHRDLAKYAMSAAGELPLSQQEQLLSQICVREAMMRGVETTEPGREVAEVGEVMLENKFGCMPVCEGNRVVGIITEADFVRHVVENAR